MKQQKQNNKTQKAIIFDSGTLISFSMNGITRVLRELKGVFNGKFLITREVKKEVIDVPLKIKKFEYLILFKSKFLKLPSIKKKLPFKQIIWIT